MGIFHICFREFLQSIILPKMKKPPLVDPDDFEGDEELDAEEQSGEELLLCTCNHTLSSAHA